MFGGTKNDLRGTEDGLAPSELSQAESKRARDTQAYDQARETLKRFTDDDTLTHNPDMQKIWIRRAAWLVDKFDKGRECESTTSALALSWNVDIIVHIMQNHTHDVMKVSSCMRIIDDMRITYGERYSTQLTRLDMLKCVVHALHDVNTSKDLAKHGIGALYWLIGNRGWKIKCLRDMNIVGCILCVVDTHREDIYVATTGIVTLRDLCHSYAPLAVEAGDRGAIGCVLRAIYVHRFEESLTTGALGVVTEITDVGKRRPEESEDIIYCIHLVISAPDLSEMVLEEGLGALLNLIKFKANRTSACEMGLIEDVIQAVVAVPEDDEDIHKVGLELLSRMVYDSKENSQRAILAGASTLVDRFIEVYAPEAQELRDILRMDTFKANDMPPTPYPASETSPCSKNEYDTNCYTDPIMHDCLPTRVVVSETTRECYNPESLAVWFGKNNTHPTTRAKVSAASMKMVKLEAARSLVNLRAGKLS